VQHFVALVKMNTISKIIFAMRLVQQGLTEIQLISVSVKFLHRELSLKSINIDCPTGCSSCTGPNNCLGCNSGFFFLDYRCESSCPAKTFPDPPRCSNCLLTCSACSASRQCDSCQSPYVLDGNVCTSFPSGSLTSCISKYFEPNTARE